LTWNIRKLVHGSHKHTQCKHAKHTHTHSHRRQKQFQETRHVPAKGHHTPGLKTYLLWTTIVVHDILSNMLKSWQISYFVLVDSKPAKWEHFQTCKHGVSNLNPCNFSLSHQFQENQSLPRMVVKLIHRKHL